MVSDEERREVATRLRNGGIARDSKEAYTLLLSCVGIRPQLPATSTYEDAMVRLADLIEPQPVNGNTSDGYHTFNELYHHRAVLFSVIVENFAARAWKSKLHADGTMYEGMFIVGIETPDGQATYHYDVEPYWDLFRCREVDRAPEWDGHTPDQAIERIGKLVDCKTDRPTCADARRGNDVDRCDDAPDSWERLEGDVRRSLGPMAACSYFGRGMGDGCRGCPSGTRGRDCNRAMAGDILRRSEALAGVARQTCRLVPCGDGTGKGACGECHGALTDKDNFCPDCGREIEVTDD